MQLAICNECKAQIGGQSHMDVAGGSFLENFLFCHFPLLVRRLGQGIAVSNSVPGYLKEGTRGEKSEEINRPELTVICLPSKKKVCSNHW